MGQWHAHVVRPKFATSVFRIGKQGTLSGFIAQMSQMLHLL